MSTQKPSRKKIILSRGALKHGKLIEAGKAVRAVKAGEAGKVTIRRGANGRYLINGASEETLVNKYPGVKAIKPSTKAGHLSADQIRAIVNSMKVAV